MKTFNLPNGYKIVCEWKKTRTAFKHTARIEQAGSTVYETKVCYLNRTWERFEFQSVAQKAIRAYFKEADQKKYIDALDKQDQEGDSAFKTIATIASLGDIFCEKKEDKIAWKKRFLAKTPGIDFPEDFDQLPEKEKQRRLDGAIKIGLGQDKPKEAPAQDDGKTYKIVRFYQDGRPRRTIKRGLNLADAQAHCSKEETHGEGWFDGYDEE